jgi:hypothetical protein
MKRKTKMKVEDILEKQMEIASHQKHFNLILAIATTFLVLIYALKESSYYSSRFSIPFFDVLSIIIIIILVVLLIFLMKKGYMEKIFGLFLDFGEE